MDVANTAGEDVDLVLCGTLNPETAVPGDVMTPLLSPMSHLHVAADTPPHIIEVDRSIEYLGEKEKPAHTAQASDIPQLQIVQEESAVSTVQAPQTNVMNSVEPVVVNYNLTNPQLQPTVSQTQPNSTINQPTTRPPASAITTNTVTQLTQPQQQQQQTGIQHPTSQQPIRPLMAQRIPTPNAIRLRGKTGRQGQNGRGNGGGYRGHGHQGRRGHGAQRGQRANGGNYSNHNQQANRGYTGQAWRGSKRARSPEQNNRDRRRIKLDLEDFLADNFGLRPSNPLTLEQFVAELKKE